MTKIIKIFEAKIIQDEAGWWRVLRSTGVISGKHHTKRQAQEYLRIHFEQAKADFGEKYEVILKISEQN
ncbi:MAG TPA: hypothetical protein VMR59_01250 [Patescibacteria group bacterium]|jgi:alkylated DNA nucleotide flippase Atl1|nr:hypothetical protein [Patescibacteria group bacterium]